MAKEYYAHVADDGRLQTVEEHLTGTALLCASFTKEFGAEEQGRYLGLLHDIGKYSDEFQQRLFGGPKVDHATAGALESAKKNNIWASFCIAGHHSGIPDGGNQTDISGDPTLWGRLKKGLEEKIPSYINQWIKMPAVVPSLPNWGKDSLSDSFWIRMLFSSLVDADYLDTESFMNPDKTARGGYDSISVLLDRLKQYVSPWANPKTELNRLRCQILKDCMDGARSEKGLYSLTVPTGGGKTVDSMAFALNHAKANGMSRIIYVIPYMSIIEQNAAVFRDIFGDENVIEHHSGIFYDIEGSTDERSCRQALAAENWDAPIIVTTAVQFFESIYANRSSQCRKVHNISNSVIVFDEVQMMPSAHLRPCVAAIGALVQNFGSTAVLCTATQPALNEMLSQYCNGMVPREICQNKDDMYQKFRRVSFRNAGKLSDAELTAELSNLPQVLCVVNTRKAAQTIYEAMPKDGSYHLSTLMTPSHRRRILDEVRERLSQGLPCRVISTSLIEAGVDVDFPAVYRELSGLDSIMQAAGRCNREGKRLAEESIVTIFESETPCPPLLKINVGAAKEVLSSESDISDPNTIDRYFRSYLSLVGGKHDKCGVIEAMKNGIYGCYLPFRQIAEQFHLIDNATKTVYVPVGAGSELIERLKSGERSRALYRKVGQYGVNIFQQHYAALLSAGDIELLDDGSAILTNLQLYDENKGLSLVADVGKCLFV